MRIRFALLSGLMIAAPLFGARDVTSPTYGLTSYPIRFPSVAWNGTTFLSLWTVQNTAAGTFASLADANGEVLTPVSYPLPGVSSNFLVGYRGEYLATSSDRSKFVIIGADGRSVRDAPALPPPRPEEVRGATNGAETMIVDTTGAHFLTRNETTIDVSIRLPRLFDPFGITSSGNDFIVATGDDSGVYVQRVSRDGKVYDPVRINSAAQGLIAVASSGTEVIVAWTVIVKPSPGHGAPPSYEWRTTSLHDATVSPPTPITNLTLLTPTFLASVRGAYVLVSVRQMMRLDRDGHPTTTAPASIGYEFAVAANDRTIFVAEQEPADQSNVYRVLIRAEAPGLEASGATPLSITLRRQIDPAIASDGFEFLCVWTDAAYQQSRHAAIRLSRIGTAVEGMQTETRVRSGSFFPDPKDLIFGPGRFLLTGVEPPPTRPELLPWPGDLTAAWDGQHFLVVHPGRGGSSAITASLNREDQTQDAFVEIAHEPAIQPHVAFDGRRFLVIWLSGSPVLGPSDVRALRISTAGTLLDAQPVTIARNVLRARLASNGSDFALVVDTLQGVDLIPIDGATMSARAPVPIDRGSQFRVSDVTSDGTDYIVAWRYGRFVTVSYPFYLGTVTGSSVWWVAMARVAGGNVRTPRVARAGIPDDIDISRPAVASNRIGDTIAVVSETASPPGIARLRSYVEREMDAMPSPPPAPRIVDVKGSAKDYTVEWATVPGAEGYLLERRGNVIGVFTPDTHSVRIAEPFSFDVGFPLLLRAFNAGGVSNPIAITPPPRRRTAAH